MEFRNVRRVYMLSKALTVYRRRSGVNVSRAGLNVLYCLCYHGGRLAASSLRDLMAKSCVWQTLPSVLGTLEDLVVAGYVVKDANRCYYISADGRNALALIEKLSRTVRPDK